MPFWMAGCPPKYAPTSPPYHAPVFRVAGGVDAHEAASRANVSLEGGLLGLVQNIPGGQQKQDGIVGGEALVVEDGGILGRVDAEAVLRTEPLHDRDGVGNRGVPETGRLRENQNPAIRSLGGCAGPFPFRRRAQKQSHHHRHPAYERSAHARTVDC